MKIIFLFFILFMCGCFKDGCNYHIESNVLHTYTFKYIKDKRTDLCFAVLHSGDKFGLTNVPCEAYNKAHYPSQAKSK